MSNYGKRNHLLRKALQEDINVPKDNQKVVRVLAGRGNNLHEVEEANGERYLVSMPSKFRRNFWIKRGDYILIEPILEGEKVKAEIVLIVTPEHKKFYQANRCWPQEFERSANSTDAARGDNLFENTNRPPVYEMSSDSESDCDAQNQSEESDSNTQEE